MNPVIARVVAAGGVVLAAVSIWVSLFRADFPVGTTGPTSGYSQSYWDLESNHAIGITILVLTVAAGIGVLLALLLDLPFFDRLWLVAGTAAGGVLLFFPMASWTGPSNSVEHIRVGGWLGFIAFPVFLLAGALFPLSPGVREETWAATPAPAVEEPETEA